MKIVNKILIVFLSLSIISFGCNASKTLKGGGIGAAAGALIGGIMGHAGGNTAEGILIGAAVGGAAGAAIGHYMDKQAEELQQDLKNAKVERVGEGIKITFPAGILFDINSYDLSSASKNDIDSLARVLQKYKDTKIVVQGYTDSTGTDAYNQTLSENRAAAVAAYVAEKGVDKSRLDAQGFGKSKPVADNGNESGRHLNRRVEIAIMADEALKKEAEQGNLKG